MKKKKKKKKIVLGKIEEERIGKALFEEKIEEERIVKALFFHFGLWLVTRKCSGFSSISLFCWIEKLLMKYEKKG